MKYLLLLLFMIPFVSKAQKIDSLVIYYRPFCADFHFQNTDVNKIKTFGGAKKIIIQDSIRIQEILLKMKDLDRKWFPKSSTHCYYLGAYIYSKNEENLLFTISDFQRLTYKRAVYLYSKDFMDFIFNDKRDCYY